MMGIPRAEKKFQNGIWKHKRTTKKEEGEGLIRKATVLGGERKRLENGKHSTDDEERGKEVTNGVHGRPGEGIEEGLIP